MVNVNKLKGKIVEANLNVSKVAEAIGIDDSTLYRKLRNSGASITIKEANEMVKLLKLTSEEARLIFFSDIVA